VSAFNERHRATQEALERLRKASVIAAWHAGDGRYAVLRTRGSDWTELGRIGCAEAFVLGVYSGLNFAKRGAA
jgi:hypothetical protein